VWSWQVHKSAHGVRGADIDFDIIESGPVCVKSDRWLRRADPGLDVLWFILSHWSVTDRAKAFTALGPDRLRALDRNRYRIWDCQYEGPP